MRFEIMIQTFFKKAVLLSIILTSLAFPESSLSRIGENFSECESRYGKHAKESTVGSLKARVYSKQGYLVIVFFSAEPSREYIAQGVLYSKPGPFTNQSLSADEVENFLQANSDFQAWNRVDAMREAFGEEGLRQREIIEDAVKYERWVRSDGACFAFFGNFDNTLGIYSPALAEYFSKQPGKDMSGF